MNQKAVAMIRAQGQKLGVERENTHEESCKGHIIMVISTKKNLYAVKVNLNVYLTLQK